MRCGVRPIAWHSSPGTLRSCLARSTSCARPKVRQSRSISMRGPRPTPVSCVTHTICFSAASKRRFVTTSPTSVRSGPSKTPNRTPSPAGATTHGALRLRRADLAHHAGARLALSRRDDDAPHPPSAEGGRRRVSTRRCGAHAGAARAAGALRPHPRDGTVVAVPARTDLSATERRAGRGRAIRRHPRQSRSGTRVSISYAGAAWPCPRSRAHRRCQRRAGGIRHISRSVGARRSGSSAAGRGPTRARRAELTVPMDPLHRRAKDIFLAALEQSGDARVAYLDEACGDDGALRREIESLLAFHEEGTSDPSSSGLARDRFAHGDVIAERYRMVPRIGRGGTGDVWRADDLVLEMPVALKIIDSTDPQARQRILNEVRLARQITHPAVCRVFDVGEAEGGVVFYTMELVPGEDLASLLRRVGRLPSDRVVDLAHQLCAGLAAAHAQGILHRDLKPANVLVDDDGKVRITDFGIAIPRNFSGQHMRTGTPGYMAPEQRVEGTQLTERTDVYSLGLVLYELLVGRYAFEQIGS